MTTENLKDSEKKLQDIVLDLVPLIKTDIDEKRLEYFRKQRPYELSSTPDYQDY